MILFYLQFVIFHILCHEAVGENITSPDVIPSIQSTGADNRWPHIPKENGENASEYGGDWSPPAPRRNLGMMLKMEEVVHPEVKWWKDDPAQQKRIFSYCLEAGMEPGPHNTLLNVFNYIEAGSNIKFQEKACGPKAGSIKFGRYTSLTTKWMYLADPVSIRKLDASMTFPDCLVAVLELLGFAAETDRDDLPPGLERSPGCKPPYNASLILMKTPYDIASIMHPAISQNTVYGCSPYNTDNSLMYLTSTRRGYMSTCDWHLLNKAYPGKRLPPVCVPGKIMHFLRPISNERGAQNLNYYGSCFLNSYSRNDEFCKMRSDKVPYPTVDFIPGTDNYEKSRRQAFLLHKYGRHYEKEHRGMCVETPPLFVEWVQLICRISGKLVGVKTSIVDNICKKCATSQVADAVACVVERLDQKKF